MSRAGASPLSGRAWKAEADAAVDYTPKRRQAVVTAASVRRHNWAEAVRKLGEILQTIEQSKIFSDFSDSERSKASKKRTKQVRGKTPGSFHTASAESGR